MDDLDLEKLGVHVSQMAEKRVERDEWGRPILKGGLLELLRSEAARATAEEYRFECAKGAQRLNMREDFRCAVSFRKGCVDGSGMVRLLEEQQLVLSVNQQWRGATCLTCVGGSVDDLHFETTSHHRQLLKRVNREDGIMNCKGEAWCGTCAKRIMWSEDKQQWESHRHTEAAILQSAMR